MVNRFHACATCVHFCANRTENGMKYVCSRLGFETKTSYQFNCWDPKPHVLKLMVKGKNK
nr:hypothetical protein [Mesobacillus persicus]